ncbi:MAG: hypothetical protein HFI42_09265 [Lachnospiraceae bacterium]|nr:hypothetical protein [Lachnospiraceae bacterium]MCI9150663.1 hypothetical protein [Lachnospiraceae bacterium]
MASQRDIYIGIDLNDIWTQISYCTNSEPEPETVSLVAGEEFYRIPTALCRLRGAKGFCLPDASGERASDEDTVYIDRLWERSLEGEQILVDQQEYPAAELLALYLKKLLRMVPGLADASDFSGISHVTFHLGQLDFARVRLLRELMGSLGIKRELVSVQDDRESFCHFAMNQKKELKQYDNILFLCERSHLFYLYLTRDRHTRPEQILLMKQALGELPAEPGMRDQAFARHAEKLLKGRMVSAVYLTGGGLEGGWMKESLAVLCRGRRVFQGWNLFAKGAGYGSRILAKAGTCDYVYFSEYKLKRNIFLKVREGDRTRYHEMAEAGQSRYEISSACQVLLSGDPQIEVWFQSPASNEADIRSLQLTDLPIRPRRMTRLQIELYSGEDNRLWIRIADLGFGSWYPSSGKVWEYSIDE